MRSEPEERKQNSSGLLSQVEYIEQSQISENSNKGPEDILSKIYSKICDMETVSVVNSLLISFRKLKELIREKRKRERT